MPSKSIRACTLSILAFAALSGALFFGTVGTATADPAVVIKNDGLCGMPGSDADGNMTFGGIGVVTTTVENGNKVMIKCKGEGIFNGSSSGKSFKDFGCGVISPVDGGFYFTTNSSATVSASGVGTLTCTYTK